MDDDDKQIKSNCKLWHEPAENIFFSHLCDTLTSIQQFHENILILYPNVNSGLKECQTIFEILNHK
jgi:hypothetical protein